MIDHPDEHRHFSGGAAEDSADDAISFDPLDPLGLSRLGPLGDLDTGGADPLGAPAPDQDTDPLGSWRLPPLPGERPFEPDLASTEPLGRRVDAATGRAPALPDPFAPADPPTLAVDPLAARDVPYADADLRTDPLGADPLADDPETVAALPVIDLGSDDDAQPTPGPGELSLPPVRHRWDPLSDDLPEDLAAGLTPRTPPDALRTGSRVSWADEPPATPAFSDADASPLGRAGLFGLFGDSADTADRAQVERIPVSAGPPEPLQVPTAPDGLADDEPEELNPFPAPAPKVLPDDPFPPAGAGLVFDDGTVFDPADDLTVAAPAEALFDDGAVFAAGTVTTPAPRYGPLDDSPFADPLDDTPMPATGLPADPAGETPLSGAPFTDALRRGAPIAEIPLDSVAAEEAAYAAPLADTGALEDDDPLGLGPRPVLPVADEAPFTRIFASVAEPGDDTPAATYDTFPGSVHVAPFTSVPAPDALAAWAFTHGDAESVDAGREPAVAGEPAGPAVFAVPAWAADDDVTSDEPAAETVPYVPAPDLVVDAAPLGAFDEATDAPRDRPAAAVAETFLTASASTAEVEPLLADLEPAPISQPEPTPVLGTVPAATTDADDHADADGDHGDDDHHEPLNPPAPVHPDRPTERAFMTYSGFSGERRHVGFQIGSLPEPMIPERGVPNLVVPPTGDGLDTPASAVARTPVAPVRAVPPLTAPAQEPVPALDPTPAPVVDARPAATGDGPPADGEPSAAARPDGTIVPIPALSADAGPSVVPQGRRVRAAVYNRFWHSMGGGERHNGMIAQVLAHDGAEVDIIGHSDVDLGQLGRHLGLDLSGCRYRRIPDRGEEDLAALSTSYDLFVNGSYMSRLATRSRRAAYLCFFPTPADHDMAAWRRAAVRSAGPLLRGVRTSVDFGIGWYPPEGGRLRQWCWSAGNGVLSVTPGSGRSLRADFGRPGAPSATPLRFVGADGETFAKIEVGPEFAHHEIPLPDSDLGIEITLVSDTFTPGPSDVRDLGIAISRPRISDGQDGARAKVALRFPWLTRDPNDFAWVDRYDVVMANSDYTRGWIRRMWRQEADVLYPPIQVDRLHPAGTREKTIVTVGRFFAPGLGHAKRQLEMVHWFGELHASGAIPGWTMHVVGGLEDSQKPYVEQIRKAAAGLPVEIHPNAPRSDVEKLLSTASVFWSATGWGDDDRRRPWTAEHFGMTTVEAMAGGCVPVVIDRAGQREIVRHGIDGYRWTDPEQLKSFTRRLANEDGLRARLATEAIQRAQQFSDAAFAERWRSIAARHHLYEG